MSSENNVTCETQEEAEAAKTTANAFFKGLSLWVCECEELCVDAKYSDALQWYDKAIELDGSNAIYFANRAFAHIKLEKLGAAIADATQAIELNPKYVKAGSQDHLFSG